LQHRPLPSGNILWSQDILKYEISGTVIPEKTSELLVVDLTDYLEVVHENGKLDHIVHSTMKNFCLSRYYS
jgi:hypothetical protein